MLNAPLQGGRFESRVDLRPSIYRAMLAAAPAVQGEPDSLPMEPYQTVDRGSPHYKAGWNAFRRAMFASAPAVRGEPVAVVDAADDGMWADILPNVTVKVGQALYTAPQPAEQQPDVTLLLSLLSHARCNTCDGSGGLYDNHGQPHQCQWCHERSEALSAYREGGDV